MGGIAKKCCRHDETSPVPLPRRGIERRGKSKEGAKVYLMGANGIDCLWRQGCAGQVLVFFLFCTHTQKIQTEDVR